LQRKQHAIALKVMGLTQVLAVLRRQKGYRGAGFGCRLAHRIDVCAGANLRINQDQISPMTLDELAIDRPGQNLDRLAVPVGTGIEARRRW
jgi:hypothetical protein